MTRDDRREDDGLISSSFRRTSLSSCFPFSQLVSHSVIHSHGTLSVASLFAQKLKHIKHSEHNLTFYMNELISFVFWFEEDKNTSYPQPKSTQRLWMDLPSSGGDHFRNGVCGEVAMFASLIHIPNRQHFAYTSRCFRCNLLLPEISFWYTLMCWSFYLAGRTQPLAMPSRLEFLSKI